MNKSIVTPGLDPVHNRVTLDCMTHYPMPAQEAASWLDRQLARVKDAIASGASEVVLPLSTRVSDLTNEEWVVLADEIGRLAEEGERLKHGDTLGRALDEALAIVASDGPLTPQEQTDATAFLKNLAEIAAPFVSPDEDGPSGEHESYRESAESSALDHAATDADRPTNYRSVS